MVIGEKPATSHGKVPSGEFSNKKREESPPRVKSHWSGDKKKKMKKVVYYETNSSSPSTSLRYPLTLSSHFQTHSFTFRPTRQTIVF
jgi:hypothetical protein